MAEDESRVYKASELHKRRAAQAPLSQGRHEGHAGSSVQVERAGAVGDSVKLHRPSGFASGEEQQLRSSVNGRMPSSKPVDSGGTIDGAAAKDSVAGKAVESTVTVKSIGSSRKHRKLKASQGVHGPRKKRGWGFRIVSAILALALAAVLVFAGYFAADRWLVYDDHLNMQGEWHAEGSDASIVITEDKIMLGTDTEYEYSIDSVAKTISYQFGELKGEGRYWFSGDRNRLVITDGSGYTALNTTLEDLARTVSDFVANAFGDGAVLPSGDGVIVLSK